MLPLNLKNQTYLGSMNRESLFDLQIPTDWNQTLVIFTHGFMGYKDWGPWHLVQAYFVQQGFGFAKMNLSHNGGTAVQGIDFPDVEAFAQNTYSIEVADIGHFRKHLSTLIQPKFTCLIGHSRGGGDVILHANKVPTDKIALWASIADIGSRFPDEKVLNEWRDKGVRTILNGRTRQYLPQNFTLYEDFIAHQAELNIQSAIESLKIPKLVVHGDADTSVFIHDGEALAAWGNTQLQVIEGADHVFDSKHPWTNATMPTALHEVCKRTLDFFTF